MPSTKRLRRRRPPALSSGPICSPIPPDEDGGYGRVFDQRGILVNVSEESG